MRKAIIGLAVLALFFVSKPLAAQSGASATFVWTASSSANGIDSATFSTIDGVATSYTGGWDGGISVTNGVWLGLTLPEPGVCSTTGVVTDPCPGIVFPTFPNNGSLGNGPGGTQITWGAKTWVIGNGTHAGDSYTIPGTATAIEWNGSVAISFTEYRTMVQHHSCYRGRCSYWLVDTLISGTGTATVQ